MHMLVRVCLHVCVSFHIHKNARYAKRLQSILDKANYNSEVATATTPAT